MWKSDWHEKEYLNFLHNTIKYGRDYVSMVINSHKNKQTRDYYNDVMKRVIIDLDKQDTKC